MANQVSIRPSDMVEGGILPINQNLTVKQSRYGKFDYTKKDGTVVASTTAFLVKLVGEDGTEHDITYSMAGLDQFVASEDGMELLQVGAAERLSKNSNFAVLMTALKNCGFPENKMGPKADFLEKLNAHWIGTPEPKRTGLVRAPVAEGQTARERDILIPDHIINMPWEPAKKAPKPAAGKQVPAATAKSDGNGSGSADLVKKAIDYVGKAVGDGGSAQRRDIAALVYKEEKGKDRDAVANLIFSPDLSPDLLAAGFALDGETITKR